MQEIERLSMEFDLNTLDHLGVKLYKQYSLIIAELVSNSWDADATKVDVQLYSTEEGEHKIIVLDNGTGMTYNELQNNFLKIGRNRRITEKIDKSLKYGRKVVGKKGIGKLSMFGLANTIEVETIKEGKKNIMRMRYSDIKSSAGRYFPEEIIKNQSTEEEPGTKITLSEIKRSKDFSFDVDTLGINLSKRFSIFGEENNFITNIYLNNEFKLEVTNLLKYKGINMEMEWKVPDCLIEENEDLYKYFVENNINGYIYTAKNTLPKTLQGITLLARKKLAEENSFFNDRAQDFFHDYCYGFLNVDFIDESTEEDYISTDRKSIIWEEEVTSTLRINLNKLINKIQSDWRKQRKDIKKKELKEKNDIDIDKWISEIEPIDKTLAKSLVDIVLNDDSLDVEKTSNYMEHIKDVFSYETFKNEAAKMLESESTNHEVMLKIISDWNMIESKELAKVAEGRIKTIENFRAMIENNSSETKAIQPFFESFPWILDPKMNTFERELTIKRAIEQEIISKEAPDYGINVLKRMDFFVTQNENVYRIYELKRPEAKLNLEMVSNIKHYIRCAKNFLKKGKVTEQYDVKAVLIVNNLEFDEEVNQEIGYMTNAKELIVSSYNSLLIQAENYNKEFIKKYEELKEKKMDKVIISNEGID